MRDRDDSSTPVLEFDGVVAGYGGRPVVNGVSFGVAAGEVVGLVGPNGSGKTTLVRVASRSLRPTRGAIRVGGRDPFSMSGREAARMVGVVPQDVEPAFSFTVLEMVLMGRSPYRSRWGSGSALDWERAREALATVGMQHLADRDIAELSGGERRRVILAQALAQDAPVLLLDEPTTHLDIRHVVDLLATVRALAEREGKAILAVLHDLTVASAVCDRLVALHRGEVVADGRPEGVVTRAFLSRVYEVDTEVEISRTTGRPAVVFGVPGAAAAGSGLRVHVVGGAGRAAPLVRLLAERGIQLSIGVLHGTDTDDDVAARLDLLRVSVPPFSEIDEGSAAACLAMMRAARALVVVDAPYGPGNLRNLELASIALDEGVPVVLMDRMPIEERDFTGGKATDLWLSLRRRSRIAGSPEEVLLLLEELLLEEVRGRPRSR